MGQKENLDYDSVETDVMWILHIFTWIVALQFLEDPWYLAL